MQENVNLKEKPPMTLADVGRLIQYHRIKKGYETQKDFAEAVGLSKDTINDIENGRGKAGKPAYNTVARFLGIQFDITFPTD